MTKLKNENDIRIDFKNFDLSVLLGVEDVRQLIGAKNSASVYAALYRHDLPEPIIRRNRQLRWSVGQLRSHFQALEEEFKIRTLKENAASGAGASCAEKKIRTGRPRNVS